MAKTILNPTSFLRILRLATIVSVVISCTGSAHADVEDALSDAYKHIWYDQKSMGSSPLRVNKVDALVWGAAAGSLIYLAPRWGGADRSVDERFEQGIDRKNRSVSTFIHDFTHVGDPAVLLGVPLVVYGLGRWQELPRMRTASLHVFEGVMDAGIAAEIIKLLAGRRRPVDNPSRGPFLGPRGYFQNYSDNSSFLSGHAAMTFAAATIISHESGTYWVGIPAYAVAGGVAYSRIYVSRHWLSDVIAGAVLGYSVGILVEHRRHSKPKLADNRVYPMVDTDTVGIAWSRSF